MMVYVDACDANVKRLILRPIRTLQQAIHRYKRMVRNVSYEFRAVGYVTGDTNRDSFFKELAGFYLNETVKDDIDTFKSSLIRMHLIGLRDWRHDIMNGRSATEQVEIEQDI